MIPPAAVKALLVIVGIVLLVVGIGPWFYTLTRPSPSRLRLSARAMLAGLRGDFTGHRTFLS